MLANLCSGVQLAAVDQLFDSSSSTPKSLNVMCGCGVPKCSNGEGQEEEKKS